MSVGASPRVSERTPSVRSVLRTQSSVDVYFCPSAGEKPSVWRRDLITSIGKMHGHSCSGA
jgi:hypothetical protein